MKKSISLSKFYAFPVEEVWQALTDQQALSEWLMPCDFEPQVGHKFQFRSKSTVGFDGIVNCEVLELRKCELLSFSWSGGPLRNTKVTFRLTPENNGTRLDFEHSDFEGFLNQLIVRRILANGWLKKILAVNLIQYLNK